MMQKAMGIAIIIIAVAAVAVLVNQFHPATGQSGTPTPPPTLPPLATPTPTPIPPPVPGDLPAVRTAWLGYDSGDPCDLPKADVLYLTTTGCALPESAIDAGHSKPLGSASVNLPGCPGSGGQPLGRYAILIPDGDAGPTLAAFPGSLDTDSPDYRDYTYAAPESVILDTLDQRHAWLAQAHVVHYHLLPYRVYISVYPLHCRDLTGAQLDISPHPAPTPTPTPLPTPTPTPDPGP